MDHAARTDHFGIIFRLFRRAPKLSVCPSAIQRHGAIRPVIGVLLLGCAAILAKLAHEASSDAALKNWERRQSPGIGTWQLALQGSGYQRVTDEGMLLREIRLLARPDGSEDTIWASSRCLAVLEPPGNDLPKAVFCKTRLTGGVQPVDFAWKPVGTGWKAFESWLAETEARGKQTGTPGRPRQPRILADSRELRY